MRGGGGLLRLRHTVNERAVRILLECILVVENIILTVVISNENCLVSVIDTFVVSAKCDKCTNFVAQKLYIIVFTLYKFYIYNTYLCLTFLHVILILYFTFFE